jgi:hypothetical protein
MNEADHAALVEDEGDRGGFAVVPVQPPVAERALTPVPVDGNRKGEVAGVDRALHTGHVERVFAAGPGMEHADNGQAAMRELFMQ